MRTSIAVPTTPFTPAMARATGISRKRLDQLLDAGEVRRVLRGVYVAGVVPDTTAIRAASAALVLRPFVVVCDRTAAWLHGVDTFDFYELEILPPLETSALRGCSRPRRTGCRPGVRDLSPEDVMRVGDVSVTTPLRTALDLACSLSSRDALAALDAFMRHHDVTRSQLRGGLVRYFRRRGVVQARRLVALADARAESPGESWTRLVMVDAGLPVPELQCWVRHEGRDLFRLDLAYPKHRIAIEYDGRQFHESAEQRAHDLARRTWLREHGWTVIVVTRDDFTPAAIERWTGEVRDALSAARRGTTAQ